MKESRNTIKNDRMRIYKSENDKLRTNLKGMNRVSLTSTFILDNVSNNDVVANAPKVNF